MKITLLLSSVGRWREFPSLMRSYLNRRRFGRNNPPSDLASSHGCRKLSGSRKSTAKLALIVPYRESPDPVTLSQGDGRADQLKQFTDHMNRFLTEVDYHIFVIEQSQDALPFNKGYLMNVGFNLAALDFDYFAFHDVDQLPTNPRNTYAYPDSPTHLCVTTDGRTQYRSMVGGVLLINREDFIACNGWSNRYLGWGQEDDDMANRLRNTVGYERLAKDIGTYRSIDHPKVMGLDETYQFHKNRCYLNACANTVNREDGYLDATFDIQSRSRLSDRSTKHVVSIAGPSRLFGYHCYAAAADTSGNMALYEHTLVSSQIVAVHDGIIDRTRVRVRAGGGEMPSHPIPEESEYPVFENGALQIGEAGTIDLTRFEGYQSQFIASAVSATKLRSDGEETLPTFVVERREYVNLYHTLIELFNAFVAIQLLARDEPFNLLFLDGHCRGALDSAWKDILNPKSILRLHDLPKDTTRFRKLVLVPGGYASPLYDTGRIEPSRFNNFLSDFIDQILDAYNVETEPSSDRVLTFVNRIDHRPHPRSDGIVCRKVEDIDATIELLKQLYPLHRIQVRSFESLPLGEQVRIVHRSDVLCGVHGAALMHTLFMRPCTELVEFRPHTFRRNRIFENLAMLRSVHYRSYLARTKRTLADGKLVVELTTKRKR